MASTVEVKQSLDELLVLAAADAEGDRSALAEALLAEREEDPAGFDRALGRALETWPSVEPPVEEGLEAIGRPRWENYLGDHRRTLEPEDWWAPASVAELARWLERAVARRRRVRCVGHGHSSSDVAVQSDVLVAIDRLNAVDAAPEGLRDVPLEDGHHLVYAQAGVRISDLTAALWRKGLALANMGSFNGQTLAGAISTGTHGSGLHTGPLADFVRAVDLLTVERDGTVRVVRLEPADGPTAPTGFAAFASRWFGCAAKLEPDTAAFEAAVVSMGSLGIVVGYVLEVVDRFWMEEVREVRTWSELRPKLAQRVAGAKKRREHYEVSFLPNPVDGRIRCLTLVRRRHDPLDGAPPDRRLTGQWILDLARLIGTKPIGAFASAFPEFMNRRIYESFQASAAEAPFVSSAPKVFVLGYGAAMRITSCEAHVPLDRATDAVDEIVALAREHAEQGWFHTAPVGVRFAGRSRFVTSMEHDRESCTLEVPFPLGSRGWSQVLSRIEERLVARCDARMHWGQRNATTAGRAAEQYARWSDFVALRRRFGAFGTWDSPFTDRAGLSELPPIVLGAPVPEAVPPEVEEGLEGVPAPGGPSIPDLVTGLESDWEATVRVMALAEWRGHDAWAEGDALPAALSTAPVVDGLQDVLEAPPARPRVEEPRDLQELVTLARRATLDADKVRALGAGHSFAPAPGINAGDDVTVDLRRLRGERALDPALLSRPEEVGSLVEVWGGTRLFEIVELLRRRGRALANVGNYDRQAIAGALATDTHGTGLAFSPFSGLVESLLLVGSGGQRFRIDRTDPMYAPAAYAAAFPGVHHVRDDAKLADAAVSVGAMGIVAAVALRTRPTYHLEEERLLGRWTQVRKALLAADLERWRESVAISTYVVQGHRRCLRTRRRETTKPEHLTWDQAHRTFWAAVASPSPLAGVIAEARLKDRDDRGEVIHGSMKLLQDEAFVARWDKVLITGPPAVRAHSMEIGLSFDDRERALGAVDLVLETLDPEQNGGTFWPTSPINLRWCGPSEAGISPMFRRPTMMIEVPFLVAQRDDPKERVDVVLRGLEKELVRKYAARPHWGKAWWLKGLDVAKVYPGWERWNALRAELDPAGTFTNSVTRAVGLTP